MKNVTSLCYLSPKENGPHTLQADTAQGTVILGESRACSTVAWWFSVPQIRTLWHYHKYEMNVEAFTVLYLCDMLRTPTERFSHTILDLMASACLFLLRHTSNQSLRISTLEIVLSVGGSIWYFTHKKSMLNPYRRLSLSKL